MGEDLNPCFIFMALLEYWKVGFENLCLTNIYKYRVCVIKMIGKISCSKCHKHINLKEKQIGLTSHINGKIIKQTNWHFFCWIDYYNKKVDEKAKENLQLMIAKKIDDDRKKRSGKTTKAQMQKV